jgi:hypothetical protein
LPFSRIGKSYIWLEVAAKSFLALEKNRASLCSISVLFPHARLILEDAA